MARVFTTTFQYNGQSYSAIIAEQDKSLTVTLMDGTLQLVIPLAELSPASDNTSAASISSRQDAQNLVAAALIAVDSLRKREQRLMPPIDGGENTRADKV